MEAALRLEGDPPEPAFTLLIVDDDPQTHAATRFALTGVTVLGRPLTLLHAESAEAASARLADHPETALVVVDVEMERATSGLDLIDEIRRRPELDGLRILIRTGRSHLAPADEVLRRFDVAGYLEKSSMSRSTLVAALTAAARWHHHHRHAEMLAVHPERPLVPVPLATPPETAP